MNRLPAPAGNSRIAVLCGGESAEREISLQSGQAVVEALTARGYACVAVDPATVDLNRFDWGGVDAAFIALHGEFGEDGQVQQMLDDLKVPYTGSGPDASRIAFQKSAAKERFRNANLPTPSSMSVHETDDAAVIARRAAGIGFPLVVKPEAQGSSLGVSIVEVPEQLAPALSRCFHFGPCGILESFVRGPEITVALVDGEALPPIRVATERSFFDYRAKYEDDATEYSFEPGVSATVSDNVVRTAIAAGEAIGTTGLVRVDLIVDRGNVPFVLEVNTVPGFTSHSLVPKAAARAGMTPADLFERVLGLTLQSPVVTRQAG